MASRRRKYSDSDEEDDRARKRRTREVDIEDRLKRLITRVGEKSTSSLEENLDGLAVVLNEDLVSYKDIILKILCECVLSMPEKCTVYTTLVGLLNARSYNAGGEFVEMLVRNLKEALKTQQFENARLMVRFLADLVNCHVVVAASLLLMFDNFIETTMEDDVPAVRADWYVYAVLTALPWVGRELRDKKETEFQRLLNSIENYLLKRDRTHLKALQVWSTDEPHRQEEYLDCLWAQIKQLQHNSWIEKHINRPYLNFYDRVLSEALQHTLPQIIPPSHDDDVTYPLPKAVFRMFDYTDVPEGPVLPGAHAIERFLIEEHLARIIVSNKYERKDAAAALLSYSPRARIPINYMIVEVVFGQLFTLPRPPTLEIFYGSLLIELCKLQPGSMPQVLAQATEMLFERLDNMNTSCIERFVSWFSYHLSNFQFKWSWDEWEGCLRGSLDAPKPKFIKETLVKCMRLSYHKRIVEIMPPEFEEVLPKEPVATCKYFDEEAKQDLIGADAAQRLMAEIKQKCSGQDVVELLREVRGPGEDDDMGEEEPLNALRIDVFVQTLLFLGKKSFSHSFAGVAKFHSVFKYLSTSEEAQIQVLKSMHEIWRNHQQMQVVLVDKFVKTQIVDCSAVANWIFSTEMQSEFTSFYVWEILHQAIHKMSKQVSKLTRETDEARDYLEAADRRARAGFEVEEMDEKKLEDLEERLENTQSEQKKMFLIIFQRFIITLTDHVTRCEGNGVDHHTPWFKWAVERLQQVFQEHHEQVYKYKTTLEELLFTSDIDVNILQVFQRFCALKS